MREHLSRRCKAKRSSPRLCKVDRQHLFRRCKANQIFPSGTYRKFKAKHVHCDDAGQTPRKRRNTKVNSSSRHQRWLWRKTGRNLSGEKPNERLRLRIKRVNKESFPASAFGKICELTNELIATNNFECGIQHGIINEQGGMAFSPM